MRNNVTGRPSPLSFRMLATSTRWREDFQWDLHHPNRS